MTHHPSKLWFEVYHSTPGFPVIIDWKGGYFDVLYEAAGRPLRVASPSEDEWERFWEVVGKSGVWNWGNYPNPEDIMDGSTWHLKIEWGNKLVDSFGHMSYPGQGRNRTSRSRKFKEFIGALERLLGLKEVL